MRLLVLCFLLIVIVIVIFVVPTLQLQPFRAFRSLGRPRKSRVSGLVASFAAEKGIIRKISQ